MKRIAEPELMTEMEQVTAYAGADFSEPNDRFMTLLVERCADLPSSGMAADLGCGPGDIALRFARAFAGWRIDAVDGSPAMLESARAVVEQARLGQRVHLHHLLLPAPPPNETRYQLVISNSLLHHLSSGAVMWSTVRDWLRSDGVVFVMDLMRPASAADARRLVAMHAAGEPPVLQRDFYNSLLAAYRPEEVRRQLVEARLDALAVEAVSDRHMVVSGRIDRA